jgi:hypothetical protein
MLINHKYYHPAGEGSGGTSFLNKENYEYYFLLYIDGELNETETKEVENFIAANPGYRKELDQLLETRLQTGPVLFDKTVLHRQTTITAANYENFLLRSIDQELTKEEKEKLDWFLQDRPEMIKELEHLQKTKLEPITAVFNKSLLQKTTHPAFDETTYSEILCLYTDGETTPEQNTVIGNLLENDLLLQQELALLQKTKMEAETIVYPFKKTLYRKEEKPVRVIPIWARFAAAVCLLLMVSLFAGKNYFLKKSVPADPELAKESTPVRSNPARTPDFRNGDSIIRFNNSAIPVPDQVAVQNKINGTSTAMPKQPDVVKNPLNQNNIVTNSYVVRNINDNSAEVKKVLNNNAVANVPEKDLIPVKTGSEKIVEPGNGIGSIKNLGSIEVASLVVPAPATSNELSIMNIDAAKIDKKGKANRARNRIGNFLKQKLDAISNTSIGLGRYEIALAR